MITKYINTHLLLMCICSNRNASRDESVETGDESVETRDESIEAGVKHNNYVIIVCHYLSTIENVVCSEFIANFMFYEDSPVAIYLSELSWDRAWMSNYSFLIFCRISSSIHDRSSVFVSMTHHRSHVLLIIDIRNVIRWSRNLSTHLKLISGNYRYC